MNGVSRTTRIAETLTSEDGQGLMEYALVLLFVSIVLMAALTSLGDSIGTLISRAGSAF